MSTPPSSPIPCHSLSSSRYPGFANLYGPGVPAGPGCFPSEGGPQRQPGLHRPLQHDAHRGAQPVPGHSAAGRVAHEPSRRAGVHPPGRPTLLSLYFIKGDQQRERRESERARQKTSLYSIKMMTRGGKRSCLAMLLWQLIKNVIVNRVVVRGEWPPRPR